MERFYGVTPGPVDTVSETVYVAAEKLTNARAEMLDRAIAACTRYVTLSRMSLAAEAGKPDVEWLAIDGVRVYEVRVDATVGVIGISGQWLADPAARAELKGGEE